jgi:hypothetical protein
MSGTDPEEVLKAGLLVSELKHPRNIIRRL